MDTSEPRNTAPPAPPAEPSNELAPAFWAGIAFALLAPPFFWPAVRLLLDALGAVLWSADPWNMFGPGPVLNTTELNKVMSWSRHDWFLRMSPAYTCAAMWFIAHARRTTLTPFWRFALLGTAIPALIVLVGAPIYAALADPRAGEAFARAARYLQDPSTFHSGRYYLSEFLARSYPQALFQGIVTAYLPTLVGTWIVARLMDKYTRSLRARQSGSLAAAFGRDLVGNVVGFAHAILQLAGFGDRPVSSGHRVARGVARPWLIPAVCTLIFVVVNRIPHLFPVMLVLAALVAYVVVRGIWAIGTLLGITRFAFGGAMVGILSALLVGSVCFLIGAQGWVLRLKLNEPPQLFILVSYLPVLVALLLSIGSGARDGFNANEPQAAPRLAPSS